MDAIRIQIIRDCDPKAKGGTVVDDAFAVLGDLPDGSPLLDATLAAFADQYGVHSYPDPENPEEEVTVSLERNFSYRLRSFATEIVKGFVAKQAAEAARAQAEQQAQDATDAVAIVEA